MSKAREVEFKPGWLQEQMDDARVSIAEKYDPAFVIRYMAGTVTLPLERKQADELYKRLNARFEAWTGRSMKEWQL